MTTRLFRNARIYTPRDDGRPARGPGQAALDVYSPGAMLVRDGIIESVGTESTVLAQSGTTAVDEDVDCRTRCLIPGLVDPHTHMCFAERREAEFEMRIQGTAYLDILARGGGILSSVRAVANADEADLLTTTLAHARSAMRLGTTTIEIKSGYGLDTENELKMLRVIDAVGRLTPLDVVATFLGAHAVPRSFRQDPDAFVDLVIEDMLPAVAKQGIARYCDVFCEKGVFTVEQTRRILTAARRFGLKLKLHADEVHDLGGARLAAELEAASADHLLAAGDNGLGTMAAGDTVAVLLPATAYSLQKPYARARFMIDSQLPVAVASDCNPGSSYTESMPFVFGLAVLNMQMTPSEALTAATLNAAHAIGMADRVGSLDTGKQADFLLLDGDSPAIMAYHAGVSPVEAVFKKGNKVH